MPIVPALKANFSLANWAGDLLCVQRFTTHAARAAGFRTPTSKRVCLLFLLGYVIAELLQGLGLVRLKQCLKFVSRDFASTLMLEADQLVNIVLRDFDLQIFTGAFDTEPMTAGELPCHCILPDLFRRANDFVGIANRAISRILTVTFDFLRRVLELAAQLPC
jgi:hypothetical protein